MAKPRNRKEIIDGMEAPAKLKAYKKVTGLSNELLAKLLGVHKQTVAYYTAGYSRPLPHVQAFIKYLTGRADCPTITQEDWLSDEEKRLISKFRSKVRALRELPQKRLTDRQRVQGRL